MITLLLGSQSPRRRALIQLLGLPVQTAVAHADEDAVTIPDPARNVRDTARLKAAVLLAKFGGARNTLLLTADTTVALDNRMLNKPADEDHAAAMLRALRDRTHEVHSGFVLHMLPDGPVREGVHTAVVTMRPYSDAEIAAYVASGDPLDKAGGYAIQHPAFRPVSRLQGCYLSVMGLPLCNIISMLQQQQLPLAVNWAGLLDAHQGYPCPAFARLEKTSR